MDKLVEGDLVVTGKDHAAMPLPGHRKPESHCVKFDDRCIQPPCNPHHHDLVEAEIRRHAHGYYELVVSWHVSSVRTVHWSVHYGDDE